MSNKYGQFSRAGTGEAAVMPDTTPVASSPEISEKFLSQIRAQMQTAVESPGKVRRAECGRVVGKIGVNLNAHTRSGEVVVDAQFGRVNGDGQLLQPTSVELVLGVPGKLNFDGALTRLGTLMREQLK